MLHLAFRDGGVKPRLPAMSSGHVFLHFPPCGLVGLIPLSHGAIIVLSMNPLRIEMAQLGLLLTEDLSNGNKWTKALSCAGPQRHVGQSIFQVSRL